MAYHYPPEPTSGALRSGYLAKYLPEFEWEPTVLTRPAPNDARSTSSVIRAGRPFAMQGVPLEIRLVPSSVLNAAKGVARQIVFFPDRAAGWIAPAVAAGLRAHRRQPFDAIVTSAMPASVHVVGSILSATLGLPWLADYRDLWTGNPHQDEPPWRAALLRMLEKCALRKAAGIATITREMAEALSALHGRSVHVVPNTFDAEEWRDVPFEKPETFRLVHCGSLYHGRRNPEPLFAQLALLRRSSEIGNFRFDFYGQDPGNLMELARRHQIEDDIHYHGVVDRSTVMRAERAASLLVIIQSDDPRTAGEYGSKIFEYQAAGPFILALGPSGGILRSYVAQNELGWFASGDEEIRAALRAANQKHLEGRNLRPNHAEGGSARSVAKGFADALNEARYSRRAQPFDGSSIPTAGFEKKETANLQ